MSSQDSAKPQKFGLLWELIATYLWIGKAPKAPGTVATAATIPIFIFLSYSGPIIYMVITFVLVGIGIFAAEAYEQKLQSHDASEIVIDEVVGYLIAMVWMPMTWQAIIVGFVLFRLLDITKPLFIGYLDKKVQGGLGVMMDDMAAGLVVNIVMQLMLRHTSWLGTQVIG